MTWLERFGLIALGWFLGVASVFAFFMSFYIFEG